MQFTDGNRIDLHIQTKEALEEYGTDKLTMLNWLVGAKTGFKVNTGKANKYMKECLDSDVWKRLMTTFNMADYDFAWNALIAACELFAELAPKVGKILGYEYNYDESERSFEFIKHIQELSETATEIY